MQRFNDRAADPANLTLLRAGAAIYPTSVRLPQNKQEGLVKMTGHTVRAGERLAPPAFLLCISFTVAKACRNHRGTLALMLRWLAVGVLSSHVAWFVAVSRRGMRGPPRTWTAEPDRSAVHFCYFRFNAFTTRFRLLPTFLTAFLTDAADLRDFFAA